MTQINRQMLGKMDGFCGLKSQVSNYGPIQIIIGIFWSNFCDSEHFLVKDQLIITLPAQSLATIGQI